MLLEEALEALNDKPVLIVDDQDARSPIYWTVSELLESIKEYEPTYLSQEVYVNNETNSIILDPVAYRAIDVGETPYYVNSIGSKEHRIRFRINENESRRTMLTRTYLSKQGAYQRKDALNRVWQRKRVLGAPLQRRPRIKLIKAEE